MEQQKLGTQQDEVVFRSAGQTKSRISLRRLIEMKTNKQSLLSYKDWEILIDREDFKRAIKWLRDEWNIPEEGFKSEGEYRSWKSVLLSKEIQHAFGTRITTETIHYFGPQEKILSRMIKGQTLPEAKITISPYFVFLKDVEYICLFLNKSKPWGPFVNHYAVFNRPLLTAQMVNPKVTLAESKLNNNIIHQALKIELGPDTTQEDVIRVWKTRVKPLQMLMVGYERPRTKGKVNFVRFINQLRSRKGVGYYEILDELKDQSSNTFGEDSKAYQNLRKGLSRYKKKTNL